MQGSCLFLRVGSDSTSFFHGRHTEKSLYSLLHSYSAFRKPAFLGRLHCRNTGLHFICWLAFLMCKQMIINIATEVIRVVIIITYSSILWYLTFAPLHCRTISGNDIKNLWLIGSSCIFFTFPLCGFSPASDKY